MPEAILFVSPNGDLVAKLQEAFARAGSPDVKIDHAPSATLATRLAAANTAAFDHVVIDLGEKAEALSLIQSLYKTHPKVPIYAAALNGTRHADPRAALKAGARRVFRKFDELPRLLAERDAFRESDKKKGRVVLFAPAQEGAGASAAALHVASGLVTQFSGNTLFAELDYHSDSVACRLKLPQPKSLSDLAPRQDWRQALSEWNGLHLLAAPTTARSLRIRGLPEVVRAVGEARDQYDFLVCDLPCNTAVVSPTLVAEADLIYVVATAELTSLYLARRRVLNLVTAGADSEKIRLVVNRDRPGAVDSDLALQVTGYSPAHRLPNDFAAASEAETNGELVAASSALGRAYLALAADICGKQLAEPDPPTGWGRLFAALR